MKWKWTPHKPPVLERFRFKRHRKSQNDFKIKKLTQFKEFKKGEK